jgi:competence protein ComEC
MRSGTIAFIAGIVLCHQLPQLHDSVWNFGVAILAMAFLTWYWRGLRYLCFAMCGFIWATIWGYQGLMDRIPPSLEGVDIEVRAYVHSLPAVGAHAARFIADVESADPRWPGVKRIRLAWYDAPPELGPGQRWTVLVRLRAPNGFRNTGGFDFERWLFARAISATGYVREARSMPEQVDSIFSWVQRARWAALRRQRDALAGADAAGLVQALTLGVRHNITSVQWETMRATGTSHLMAISGLHVGLAAGAGMFCLTWLGRRWQWFIVRFSASDLGVIGAVLLSGVYAAMAGWSLPTQRAFVMVCIWGLSTLARRNTPPSVMLAWAGLGIAVLDPAALLDTGFWLSFGAVGILIFALSMRAGPASIWWRWGRPQWAISLGLAPLVLNAFGTIPVLGILANALAIPFVGFAVVPLVLVGTAVGTISPLIGNVMLRAGEWLLDAFWPVLDYIAFLSPPHPSLPAMGAVTLVALAGAVAVLAPAGVPGRWLGLVVMALCIVRPIERLPENAAAVHVLDVGQGLAVVVETADRVLLYDTGPRFGPGFDAARAAIIPFLRNRRWQHLDAVVVSHGDSDHIGGYTTLNRTIAINETFSNVRRISPTGPCTAGSRWTWSGVVFEVLHPKDPQRWSRNNSSCVVKVSTPWGSVLLAGDIERGAEAALVQRYGSALQADVLVLGHHGSKTSSSDQFLRAVHPKVAVASVGYRNRYGLPAPTVLARLKTFGVDVRRTDHSGAVSFTLARSTPLTPVEHRASGRRFYHR